MLGNSPMVSSIETIERTILKVGAIQELPLL